MLMEIPPLRSSYIQPPYGPMKWRKPLEFIGTESFTFSGMPGLDPEWAQVERRTLPIAAQAISTLIQYQGIGDLYRIYTVARRDGIDFNLAYIPPNFVTPHKEEFDTVYMRALYDVGYKMAEKGYVWTKEPPVLIPTSE
jgi:hypothetical protein